MKFFEYLSDRGERVQLEAIEKPQVNFSSVKDVFEKTLAHEKKVTSLINNLNILAVEVKDESVLDLLKWFIAEQVEEEENASKILQSLEGIDLESEDLLVLDKDLSQRKG